ncbi:hypothetical protein KC19_VG299300 [Ceratodon purpureus]|uniref:Uncharacterized protein n=1 Tax=Ceratodon purpureus TaxID=3225 RepID=A0A8T0HVL3_CERPU|nr:hypothetical protein KC19_VG299300 [Ceratodon purpureus]
MSLHLGIKSLSFASSASSSSNSNTPSIGSRGLEERPLGNTSSQSRLLRIWSSTHSNGESMSDSLE